MPNYVTVADFTKCEAERGDDKCRHNLKPPLCHPRMVVNDETIVAHEAQVLQMTMKDILECINDGHSNEWVDYDETDFIEGMYEWTHLCLTDRAVYELLGRGE
jgi:hypothetical protein